MPETWKRKEDLLEQCLEGRDRRGSQEGTPCLEAHPEHQAELAPLVQLANRLQAARALQASPAFKAGLRQRLQAQAQASPRRATYSRFPIPLRRPPAAFWTSALAFLLLAVLLVSVTTVSAGALPGEILYPLKRAEESIRMALTFDPAQQAGLHREYANRRIAEAGLLIENEQPAEVEQVLEDYNAHLAKELALLSAETGISSQAKNKLAAGLLAGAGSNEARLAALVETAPPSVQISVEKALARSQQAQNKARQIMLGQNGSGGSLPPPPASPTPLPTATPANAQQPPGTRPTGMTPPPTLPPTPGIRPSLVDPTPTPGLAITRPPALTAPGTKVTPTPGLSRTPSTNNSLLQTRTATLGAILQSYTPKPRP
jgi:hypothetical protein